MISDNTYADKLITIVDKEIIFRNYYFPTGRKKVVQFDDIERITVGEPSLRRGKWRLHGTGGFKTWFPLDVNRPIRDRIFIMSLKNQRMEIGFTVENGEKAEEIFLSKGLIEKR
jgi:hypothetical protein